MLLKSLFASLVLSLVSTSVLAQDVPQALSSSELGYVETIQRLDRSDKFNLNLSREEIIGTLPAAKQYCNTLRQGVSRQQIDDIFVQRLGEMSATGRINSDAEATWLIEHYSAMQLGAVYNLCTEFKNSP